MKGNKSKVNKSVIEISKEKDYLFHLKNIKYKKLLIIIILKKKLKYL